MHVQFGEDSFAEKMCSMRPLDMPVWDAASVSKEYCVPESRASVHTVLGTGQMSIVSRHMVIAEHQLLQKSEQPGRLPQQPVEH